MTQEEARLRNWLKARVISAGGLMIVKNTYTTTTEREILKEIRELLLELLDKWDENTEEFTNKPLPKYKCFCGRRTNVHRTILHGDNTIDVCLKHYNQHQIDIANE